MNGEGNIAMDVLLFVCLCLTAGVHLYCLPSWWREHEGIGLGVLLRLAGWTVIAARFGQVLFTVGDIPVSVPSAIALFLIAAGDSAGMLSRGKKP